MPIVVIRPVSATATASRTDAPNASTSGTTWSAAKEPTTAPGWRRPMTAAARPIAGMLSRGDGSTNRPVSSGSCSWTSGACVGPVTTWIWSAGTRVSRRSHVSCSRLRPEPVRSSRNFGRDARDSGHSRVPAPPAGMTAWNDSRLLTRLPLSSRPRARLVIVTSTPRRRIGLPSPHGPGRAGGRARGATPHSSLRAARHRRAGLLHLRRRHRSTRCPCMPPARSGRTRRAPGSRSARSASRP